MAINNSNRYVTPDYSYRRPGAPNVISGAIAGAIAGAGGNNAGGRGSGSGVARNSSGRTSKTGTGSISGYGATIDAYALYNAQKAAQRAAAEEAYNNTMGRIAGAYDSASGNIRGNYDSAVGRLNDSRKNSLRRINVDAEDSLRQAYINNELTKKNLNQRLSAMGYNGGATESTMANLANEYANSRTDINKNLNRNITDLEQTYGDNLAQALQAYNNAMMNLDMQRMQMENAAETARANMTTASPGLESLLTMDQNYVTALQNALLNQDGFQYQTSEATNKYNPASVQQASSLTDTTNAAKLVAARALQSGADSQQVLNSLYQQQAAGAFGNPNDTSTLAQILKQLGLG